jgi:PhnB protein
MQFIAHLNFSGNCEEAFKFYENCLGGKIQSLTRYSETPAGSQVQPDCADKVMHATLVAGDQSLMGCDAPPTHFHAPAGITVVIQLDNVAASERLFKAMTEGGNITMPLQQTFWSPRFGMFVDRFGIPWMINCTQAAQRSA